MNIEQIQNKVYQCVNNSIVRKTLTIDTPLFLDSLDCIEIAMKLEQKFKIEISDDQLEELKSTQPQTIISLSTFIQPLLTNGD